MSAEPDKSENRRLINISLDERTVVRRSADVEHERAVAIFDLLEENHFSLIGDESGPYSLHLSVQENRLLFDVRDQGEQPIEIVALPLLTSMERVKLTPPSTARTNRFPVLDSIST